MTATATNDLYSSYKRFVSSRVKHWQPKVYQNLLNMVANATDEATIDAAIRNLDHNMLKPSGIMITLESIYKDAGRVYGSKVYQVVRKQAAKIQARAKAFMPIGYNDELVAEILSYFRLHLLNQAVLPITDTMKEYIHESLIAGQQQGLSLQQVADDIEQTGFPKTRSIVITRTETIRAANFGAMQGARKSGFETEKVWIAARDFRTRRIPRDQFSHINMNGVTIPLDEPFLVPNRNGARDKLMQPGDPHGQAADVIQCRCTVGFNVLTGKDGLPLMQGARPPIQPKPTPIQPTAAPKPTPTPTPTPTPKPKTGFRPAETRQEAEQIIREVLKANTGLEFKSVAYDESMSIEKINRYNAAVNKLSMEYNISDVYRVPGAAAATARNGQLKFQSTVNFGNITSTPNVIYELNFGHRTDGLASRAKEGPGWNRFKSRVDEDNLELSTLYHEFGHFISVNRNLDVAHADDKLAPFWTELKSIKRKYMAERRKLSSAGNARGLYDIDLGTYADTNINEFMTEAFTEYKLNSNPSKYALLVGKLIDKIWGKK